MNLEAWLKQSRTLPDNLGVIEALCSALNDAHARGVVHPALDPTNVDLPPEGGVSLAEAVRGVPGRGATRYQAPEVVEGGPSSPPSDIYSAGVIFYEMLSGKGPAADRPAPLGELRPELSRDLTDAVMGCLEKGPDWRPKDLSYLAQVVAEIRGSTPPNKPQVTKAGRAETPRPAPPPPGRRGRPHEPASSSQVPLIAGALMIVVLASAGGWFWLQSQRGGPTPPTPRSSVTPPPSATASAAASSPTPATGLPRPTPNAAVSAAPTTAPVPTPAAALATPTPAATPALPTPTPRPTATPTPVTRVATPPPPTAAPATPPPPALVVATPVPLVPASLTAVTPLTVKRGSQHMIDVRGTALRADHITRFYKQGAPAHGLSVEKARWVDPTLLKVLIQVDAQASPGPYSIAILDPKNGSVSNLLTLTVTK